MPRIATNVLTPGAPDAATEDDEPTAGAVDTGDEADREATARHRAKKDSPEVAALKAQLAEANAKIAAASALPQPVFEPKTPHGEQAKKASQFLHLTSAELREKIVGGELMHDQAHYLCKDGYLSIGQPDSDEAASTLRRLRRAK